MVRNPHEPTKEEKIALLSRAISEFEQSDTSLLFDSAAESAAKPVRERALTLLDSRMRSAHELTERLLQADFPRDVVTAVVEELKGSGLVDDALFAQEWVRVRHARRGKSVTVLDRELEHKGVSADIRAHALEQITREDEEAMVRALIEKKARSIKAVPAERKERNKDLRRLVGVAARRGFPQGLCFTVAKEVAESRYAELGE
ncbi:regulatory protein RecX [Corynebacterium glucuronolyticum]|uniref:regulatory protein RecX n=1 Tax=Corynebacterium glucuronolyticum TaxID=39791 RepID=UPI0019201039|nr:regulatory protein RecX [Corynebacterium glucuronolyticum]QQU89405.1 regulatory protein RecX [Corynebacterium glucuronolyticum]